ncbi:hypothetical protein QTP70_013064 [Hemibagrus guttatus]|uniref:Uncharacterized protein n=1 Tax=Hemibagrus guttatus TaxID=175788 RepID=A0AAE0QUK4_9TELE|nr:hypothetical protein QTP70_013064 [Hemibagrus guttatus]KAK3561629.1 hypothetical protein QTP86_011170 [Hemibagrus guttatus]
MHLAVAYKNYKSTKQKEKAAAVSIYQKWTKEETLVNRRQGHGRPRITDARGEQRLARVIRSNRRDLNPIQHLWDVLDKQVRSMEAPPRNLLTGLTGSAANILVPDTTAHLQGSSGVHASTGQGCSGNKKGPTQY